MSQLKMIRLPAPLPPVSLPEGFSISTYRPGLDAEWVKICMNLNHEEKPPEYFKTKMLDDSTLAPERIFFVIAPDGRGVATASARIRPQGHGTLHMVETHADFKGRGLGSAVCIAAVGALQALGVPYVDLTTDDFRLPAIKIYLRLRFLPVLHEDDMLSRWTALKTQLGLNVLSALDADMNEIHI